MVWVNLDMDYNEWDIILIHGPEISVYMYAIDYILWTHMSLQESIPYDR